MAPAEIIAQVDDPLPRTEATPDETTWRRSRKRRFDERDETAGTENATEDSPKSKTSYQCRFCFVNFEKSQALGGHMNRHRNERDKEQLDNARTLVRNVHQQQRTWPSLAAETQANASEPGAPSQLSYPLPAAATGTYGAPNKFPNYRQGAPTGPCYMPSNPSSNNMQNAQWNLDGSLRPSYFAVDHTCAPIRPGNFVVDRTGAPIRPGTFNLDQTGAPIRPGTFNFDQTGAQIRPGTFNFDQTGAQIRPGTFNFDQTGAPIRPGTFNFDQTGAPIRPGNFAVDHTATDVGPQGSELVNRVVQDTTPAANDNSGNPNQMSPQYFHPPYGSGI